jgi:type I restriction enzyme, S subunit
MTHKWLLRPLGDVLTERREKPTIDDLDAGRVRIIEKISFNTGRIQLRTDCRTKTGMILVRPGDVVVSGINAAKGAIAIYDEAATVPAAATIHYGAYSIKPGVADVRFLWWLLRSRFFQERLVEYVPGGIKTELKAKRLLPIPIPLPPLFEQRRVVARIEELASRINEASGLRRDATEAAELLMARVAESRLSGDFPRVCLEAVCPVISDGTHQTPRYTEEGAIFLSAQNVKPFRFMPAKHRKVSVEDFNAYTARYKPRKGDVLLTRVGAGIGEAAVVDQDIEFAIYVSLALIRPDSTKLAPEFLVHWLNSTEGRASSRRETLGRGHSQGNLNLKLLRRVLLPVPSLHEQFEIVAELNALQAKVDALKQLQVETAAELDALVPAVLDCAFKGRL